MVQSTITKIQLLSYFQPYRQQKYHENAKKFRWLDTKPPTVIKKRIIYIYYRRYLGIDLIDHLRVRWDGQVVKIIPRASGIVRESTNVGLYVFRKRQLINTD
jgi:hypothetical protein